MYDQTFVIDSVTRLRNKKKREGRRRNTIKFYQDFPNCYYCGILLTIENRSLDHYVPRSRGGSGEEENLVTACKDCNEKKGNMLPSEMYVPLTSNLGGSSIGGTSGFGPEGCRFESCSPSLSVIEHEAYICKKGYQQ